MRTVELAPGIKSSVLGLGCAPILGSVGAETARIALHTALEEGVTHLDVAPSYGYGEAEAWLGRELAGRRQKVVLATKYGIVATPLAQLLSPLKPLVRGLRRFRSKPPSAAFAPPASVSSQTEPRADRFHRRVPLTEEGMRLSVERSLRRLRTDHLDWLWLHEPTGTIPEIDTLGEAAEALKKAGKLRAWGLAHMRSQAIAHAGYLERFDALQFNLSPGEPGYEQVRQARGDRPNVVFSPFRSASANLARADILRRLAEDFPRTVILCSMFSPEHIRANCRLFKS